MTRIGPETSISKWTIQKIQVDDKLIRVQNNIVGRIVVLLRTGIWLKSDELTNKILQTLQSVETRDKFNLEAELSHERITEPPSSFGRVEEVTEKIIPQQSDIRESISDKEVIRNNKLILNKYNKSLERGISLLLKFLKEIEQDSISRELKEAKQVLSDLTTRDIKRELSRVKQTFKEAKEAFDYENKKIEDAEKKRGEAVEQDLLAEKKWRTYPTFAPKSIEEKKEESTGDWFFNKIGEIFFTKVNVAAKEQQLKLKKESEVKSKEVDRIEKILHEKKIAEILNDEDQTTKVYEKKQLDKLSSQITSLEDALAKKQKEIRNWSEKLEKLETEWTDVIENQLKPKVRELLVKQAIERGIALYDIRFHYSECLEKYVENPTEEALSAWVDELTDSLYDKLKNNDPFKETIPIKRLIKECIILEVNS